MRGFRIPPISPVILAKWEELQVNLRRQRATRRLARMVETNRNSYETRRYRERREAALKGTRRTTAVT